MNLLIENTPDYILVRGKKIKIKIDFALWVKFLIAVKQEDNEVIENMIEVIFDEIPTDIEPLGIVKAMNEWLFICDNNKVMSTDKQGRPAFDFEIDGNIIFCELWQYFPELMKQGVSFPQGLELIRLLLQNEDTALYHRAFARCGDFSKMTKEQRSYWQNERSKYAIKMKQEEIDNAIASMF